MRPKTTPTWILCWALSLFAMTVFGENRPILSVDFNDRLSNTADETQPGFEPFVMESEGYGEGSITNATTHTFRELTVTVEDTLKLGYDDRCRSKPTDGGSVTQSALLRDFIFAAAGVETNAGLQVAIQGLKANEEYNVSIWSFDSMSKGKRVSRWSANGLLITGAYSFCGDLPPKNDDRYRIDFKVAADSSGTIMIRGEREPDALDEKGKPAYGVFLNALQISAIITQADNSAAVGGK